MDRYDTRIEDGTLYLDGGGGSLEVGPMADVVDILGETYTLEYDEEAQAAAWLRTEADGTITFDVRETIAEIDFNDAFVSRLTGEPLDVETEDGYPIRTAAFADLLRDIWDSKGNVEID